MWDAAFFLFHFQRPGKVLSQGSDAPAASVPCDIGRDAPRRIHPSYHQIPIQKLPFVFTGFLWSSTANKAWILRTRLTCRAGWGMRKVIRPYAANHMPKEC